MDLDLARQLASQLHDDAARFAALSEEALDRSVELLASLQEPLPDPTPDPDPGPDPDPTPDPGTPIGWGRGPVSGLPWWSGVRYPTAGNTKLQRWIAAGRPGLQCDLFQMFCGPAQCEDWNELAGGRGDGDGEFIGQVSSTDGQSPAKFFWGDLVKSTCVMTIRPVPATDSNKNGRNPLVWQRISKGEFNWAYRRLGRKMAFLDQRNGRTAKLILEVGHEMTGGWYWHSIEGGAHRFYRDAWAQIVTSMREGYHSVTNKNCPYLFWIRGSREHVGAGIMTEDWLPNPDYWDGIGLSQHDNQWDPCTPASPRQNWKRTAKAEGLSNIAEIAQKHRRLLGLWEWSSHAPEAGNFSSGPHPDIFTRSMYEWFMAVRPNLLGETYFLNSVTDFAGRPDWAGTKAYKATFGAK